MTEDQKKIVRTLAEQSMNVSETARGLNYHHNTCTYHIERIKEKTGLDPLNFFDLHELYQIASNEENTDG